MNIVRIFLLIFLGSVFLTSEKFVDTENAAKYYFTVLAVLSGIIVFVLKNKNFENGIKRITNFIIMGGFGNHAGFLAIIAFSY